MKTVDSTLSFLGFNGKSIVTLSMQLLLQTLYYVIFLTFTLFPLLVSKNIFRSKGFSKLSIPCISIFLTLLSIIIVFFFFPFVGSLSVGVFSHALEYIF